MPGSCGRSGHHRYFLAGDARRMHQILSINQRVETDQIGISIECRSRWLRAPATSPRSRFSLRWLAQIALNEAQRIRDDHVIGGW